MPISTGFQVNEILTAANTNAYLLRPYRNAIINGAMQVTQRSTSVAGITNTENYYTADRWFFAASSVGTWTQSTQNLTSSDSPLIDGARASTKVTCTTAQASLGAGAYCIFGTRLEGNSLQQFAKGTINAKHFSLSFWVRSNRTGTYIIEMWDATNTRSISASYTISASGAWQKVRLTIPPDFTGLFANDNTMGLALYMWLAAGSTYSSGTLPTAWATPVNANRAAGQVNLAGTVNNYWEVTGVQLEPNVVCTPFEVRSYAETLALCQRYFYKITGSADYEPVAAAGINVSATGHVRTTCVTPVPMRKKLATADMAWSTLVGYDGAGILFVTTGAIVGHAFGGVMVSIDWGSSGNLTTGRPVVILTQPGSTSYYFQLSAEL